MRATRLLLPVLLVVALVAGCLAPKQQQTASGEPPADGGSGTAAPSSLDALYDQDVEWTECDDLECATVRAPLDWADPEAGTIELAVSRRPADGPAEDRIGSLLINPGGPGSSGIEFLRSFGSVAGDAVLEAYDVVGFDPRGVGSSSAVDCGADATVDEFLTSEVVIEDEADLEAARQELRAFGEGCVEATGELIAHVGTESAARDLDLLRAVLGDEQLHYVGMSYGTFLGAVYADLFPENVGRLVLDAAMDPSLSIEEVSAGQAVGFENALRAYVADCQAGQDCPLTGDVDDGVEQVAQIIARAERDPFPAGEGQAVNGTLAETGIAVVLYADESWPALTMALTEVVTQDSASILLQLANVYLDRTADGEYQSNLMIANLAINCLDYPTEALTLAELDALAAEVAEEAPTFGERFVRSAGCEAWPVEATGERIERDAAGAAPIVVVGTTGDPATPYEWSVSLADQLESGVLVTNEGEGHTAYGRSACVSELVDAYLVDGEVPEDGTTC